MRIRGMAVSSMCLIASILVGCSKIAKTMELDIEKDVLASPVTLKTESEAICRERALSDSDAMKKKYAGTVMEISGTVTEIEEHDGWIDVYLAGPCPSDYRVDCMFSDNQRALVKQLKHNQHVTIKGKATSSPSFFVLHGCVLVQ